jgi:hypothetical protein
VEDVAIEGTKETNSSGVKNPEDEEVELKIDGGMMGAYG